MEPTVPDPEDFPEVQRRTNGVLAADLSAAPLGPGLAQRIDAELAKGQAVEAELARVRKQLAEEQAKVNRLDQMATAWKERLPMNIRTATVVDAIHHVTRPEA
jgi:hypothetical protein